MGGKKALIIEDDKQFLLQVMEWLKKDGLEVFVAETGNLGLREFYIERPDIVLLDTTLPGINGWEVCRRIRDMSDTPVVLLLSSNQKSEMLKGFNLGADDFICKPADFTELLARVRAVLRRCTGNRREERPVFRHPEVEVDWRSHQVFIRGKEVKLSPTEFKLLSCLIENSGWLVTHEELLRRVWGSDYINDRNFIKLYIRYLRQKIEKDPSNPRLILTERGLGYRFASGITEPIR